MATNMKPQILLLPKALLQQSILVPLATRDLVSFGLTCKAAAAAALIDDKNVWEPRWQKRVKSLPHGIGPTDWEPFTWGCNSYRELFLKVLHRYGHLLGLWAVLDTCDGGLVILMGEPPGTIKAFVASVDALTDAPLLVPVWEVDVHQPSRQTLQRQVALLQEEQPWPAKRRKHQKQPPNSLEEYQECMGKCRCAMMKLPGAFRIHKGRHVQPMLPNGLALAGAGAGAGQSGSSTSMDDDGRAHEPWRLASMHCIHAADGGLVQRVTGMRMQMRAAMNNDMSDEDDEYETDTSDEDNAPSPPLSLQPDAAVGVFGVRRQHSEGDLQAESSEDVDFEVSSTGALAQLLEQRKAHSTAAIAAQGTGASAAHEEAGATVQHGCPAAQAATVTEGKHEHEQVKHDAQGTAHEVDAGTAKADSGARAGKAGGDDGGGGDDDDSSGGSSDDEADRLKGKGKDGDTSYYTCRCSFPDIDYLDHPYMFSSSEGDHPSAWRLQEQASSRGFAHVCGGECETYAQLPVDANQLYTHPLEGLWRGSYGSHGVEVVWITTTTATTAPATASAPASTSDQQGQQGWWQWFWPQAWQRQLQQNMESLTAHTSVSADAAGVALASSGSAGVGTGQTGAATVGPSGTSTATAPPLTAPQAADTAGMASQQTAPAALADTSMGAAFGLNIGTSTNAAAHGHDTDTPSLGAGTSAVNASTGSVNAPMGTSTVALNADVGTSTGAFNAPTGTSTGAQNADVSGRGHSTSGTFGSMGETDVFRAALAEAEEQKDTSIVTEDGHGQEGGRKLCGIKLVGDPNVPAGALTLQIDVDRHMPEHPITMPGEVLSLPDDINSDFYYQGEIVPDGWKPGDKWWDDALVVRSVHRAKGQISGAGFRDARWTAAEVYTFHSMCDVHGWSEKRPTAAGAAPASAEDKKKAADMDTFRTEMYGAREGVSKCGGSTVPVHCFGVLWKGLREFSLFTRLDTEVIAAGYRWAGGNVP